MRIVPMIKCVWRAPFYEVTMRGPWRWQDAYDVATSLCRTMVALPQPKVDVIIDLRGTTPLLTGVEQHLRRLCAMMPAKFGCAVLVVDEPMAHRLMLCCARATNPAAICERVYLTDAVESARRVVVQRQAAA